jgi:hypothetical protein
MRHGITPTVGLCVSLSAEDPSYGDVVNEVRATTSNLPHTKALRPVLLHPFAPPQLLLLILLFRLPLPNSI